MPTLQPYDADRKVQILGDMWTASKGEKTLRVQLRTHPMGWELRGFVGLDMHRSQVCKTEDEVFSTSNGWKGEAVTKGWVVTS